MTRHYQYGILAAVGLLTASGCSTSSSLGTGTPAATPAAVQTSPTTPEGAPPGAAVLGTPRQGEPFDVTITSSDTTADPDRWRFTVQKVACSESLDPAVMADASDPSPAPEAGKQFCVVTIQVENIGKKQASWDTSSTVSLNVGDTRYTQSQADDDYASAYAQHWHKDNVTVPVFGLNPRSRGPAPGVFQIPEDEQPTSIWITSSTAIETINGVEPGYLVTLTRE
ncbi:DUF4352 domain-containing protein [Streptomyces sp. NPDC006984]|uniref:DUF4352 domain-containing protein n=1 Tax=Streptomyces sp. NPDC006984 TaxID=3155463 RepID=UPI0033C01971